MIILSLIIFLLVLVLLWILSMNKKVENFKKKRKCECGTLVAGTVFVSFPEKAIGLGWI
jgi:NADH:ubiquinone oxidoreductase subunit 3 (subunit A)